MLALLLLTVAGYQTDDSAGAKVINIPLTQEEYAFGVDKNQSELLDEVNASIEQIQSDGTFEEILNHYSGDSKTVISMSACSGGLLLLSSCWLLILSWLF